jgi:hypothetical protein
MNPFEQIMAAFERYKKTAPKGMPWQGKPMEMSPQARINQGFGVPMMEPSMPPQDRINGGFQGMFAGQAQQAMPPQAPPPAPTPPPQLGMMPTPMPQPRPPEAPQGGSMPPQAPQEDPNVLQRLMAYFQSNSAPSTITGPARNSEPVY